MGILDRSDGARPILVPNYLLTVVVVIEPSSAYEDEQDETTGVQQDSQIIPLRWQNGAKRLEIRTLLLQHSTISQAAALSLYFAASVPLMKADTSSWNCLRTPSFT